MEFLHAGNNFRNTIHRTVIQNLLLFIIQLADIRGNNKKNNLLKFLILQLQQSNPDSIHFTAELKSVPKAAACKSAKENI